MENLQQKPNEKYGPDLPFVNRVFRWLIRLACSLLFNITVEWRAKPVSTGCIVVANHLSWIDHLLLLGVLPAQPRPYLLGASQSLNSGFKAWLLKNLGGVILFPRGAKWVGRETFVKPSQVLRSGATLVIFPEGDVGHEEGKLLPLLRGVGHFCLLADRPIVPVAISGVRELYWRKKIRVIVGEPFHAKRDGPSRRVLVDSATEQVRTALTAILPEYIEPKVTIKPLRFLTTLSDHL